MSSTPKRSIDTLVTAVDGGRSVPTRHRAFLEWSGGRVEVTPDGPVVVGSSAQADVRIEDPLLSRLHVELGLRPDGVWARDLESRNGTWIQGVRVAHARLEAGARLRVGGTDLRLEYDEEPTPLEVWAEPSFGELLGTSSAMQALFARLAKAAATSSTVLIEAETGAGKELAARAIHARSQRASEPYVVVDCGALPDALLEAELFGHAKGAFTGATEAREGAIPSARRGTVFLDEVGELSPATQTKLLRVLETRQIKRLGENAMRTVEVRFIAATHRNLREMVGRGEFREDLFFRLAVLPVRIPPLRERRDDVPLLIAHFVERAGLTLDLDRATLDELSARRWPGNVRQLRTFAERLAAFGLAEAMQLLDEERAAPSQASPDVPFKDARERCIAQMEREYFAELLRRVRGNVSAAAELAQVDRSYVYRLIERHGLRRE